MTVKLFAVLLAMFLVVSPQPSFSALSSFATIDSTLVANKFKRIFPGLGIQSPYYRYKAVAAVSIGADQTTDLSAEYTVCFYPRTDLNQGDASYFMGWVENYKSSEGVNVKGYPNPELKSQPIFLMSESRSTGKVIDINFSKDLSPDFRDFIVSVCDQFSPPGKANPSEYSIINEAVSATPFYTATTNSRLLVELPRINEDIQTLSLLKKDTSLSDDGKLAEKIQLDRDMFVRDYSSTFAFSLQNVDNLKVADDATDIKFEGTNLNFKTNVQTTLTLVEKVVPTSDFITGVKKSFDGAPSLGAVNKGKLAADIQQQFRVDVQKKASTFTQDPTPRQMRLIDMDIAENTNFEQTILPQLRAKTYNQPLSSSGIRTININPQVRNLVINDRFSTVGELSPTSSSNPTIQPRIMSLRNAEPIASAETAQPLSLQSAVVSPRFNLSRSVFLNPALLGIIASIDYPPKNHSIYNYMKQLISQNVLGKSLKVFLKVECSITVYNKSSKDPRNTLHCSADLILNLAGTLKSVHLFDFSKVAKSWSSSANWSGSWGVGLVIPLPPPVSFIQISLSFNVGYTVGLGVYVSIAGTKFEAGSYVSAGLTASAEAGIRVLIAEGGAYISGNIVSLRTEPKVTMYLGVNAITGNAQWLLTLNAFSFRWGLYYKWCYIFGCGGRREITTWRINQGLTKTWTIFYYPFTISF